MTCLLYIYDTHLWPVYSTGHMLVNCLLHRTHVRYQVTPQDTSSWAIFPKDTGSEARDLLAPQDTRLWPIYSTWTHARDLFTPQDTLSWPVYSTGHTFVTCLLYRSHARDLFTPQDTRSWPVYSTGHTLMNPVSCSHRGFLLLCKI
jgi:hypothetical protein